MNKLELAVKEASIVELNEQVHTINLNISGYLNRRNKMKCKF